MFNFTISYFGFLKFVPGLPQLFDVWLKIYTYFSQPQLLDMMDDIEKEVAAWPAVMVTTHKYGGIQFNYHGKEIGHIHGNGLLDMMFSCGMKQQLMTAGRIQDHHHFKNSGWISFYIVDKDDKDYAIALLNIGYTRLVNRLEMNGLPKITQ